MTRLDRRTFLRLGGATAGALLVPACIREAAAIPAYSVKGSVMDVQHVVILLQENRAFDHYFGTYRGARGFGDRVTIPQLNGESVFHQRDPYENVILPFHLDSTVGNAQRVTGTPHSWWDAQGAWDAGRYGYWPGYKQAQSMGYYTEAELGFQFALADAFTLCDAYHCGIHSSTNPNRLFAFAGTNDPAGAGGGPVITNDHDDLGPVEEGYTFTTYAERLEAAGVSWKVYQDMSDNFSDNPLEGFRSFREAMLGDPNAPLVAKGLTSTLTGASLDGLRADVTGGTLPQVSWIVAPAVYSEHPGPSSPIQGAAYVQQVLEALIADPEVFAKTVLFVTFDENDGFFDHVPPPCAPSLDGNGAPQGDSSFDTTLERHTDGQVYGPGPRVPMTIVSPYSRGGYIDSQVFDHTSILQFLEARFGVVEPNISPYRRGIAGDLLSAFDFANPNANALPALAGPSIPEADSVRAAQEAEPSITAPVGAAGSLPQQTLGHRPSRALPYELDVRIAIDEAAGEATLTFVNTGVAGAVFHVYDERSLFEVPRRYAVAAGKSLVGTWSADATTGAYALFVLGPNGFHRRFQGLAARDSEVSGVDARVTNAPATESLTLRLRNRGHVTRTLTVAGDPYRTDGPWSYELKPGKELTTTWDLTESGRWYDVRVTVDGSAAFAWRFAGRMENGEDSITDPAMGT